MRLPLPFASVSAPAQPGAALATLLLLLSLTVEAHAAWPTSPLVNVPVCVEAHDQFLSSAAADGSGGIIVVWGDFRRGDTIYDQDIYAQHVLATGVVDPSWPTAGLAVCTAVSDQQSPCIVSDGSGGAIIAWEDYRVDGMFRIFAQHILVNGTADPARPVNGYPVCDTASYQTNPRVVSDGAGGAIVAWQDLRNADFSGHDIYAQHLLASGAKDGAWNSEGTAICTDPADHTHEVLTSDSAGGAIIAWADSRTEPGYCMFAQHLRATGVVDPSWPVDGTQLSDGVANFQYDAAIASDGAGGAIVSWQDLSNGISDVILTQRVRSTGVVDPSWPVSGLQLVPTSFGQLSPETMSDGSGGAFVTWQETRGEGWKVYAQHARADGTLDTRWPTDGLAVCTLTSSQPYPVIQSDGADGALIAWQDDRVASNIDVYALRVTEAGARHPAWPVNGLAISSAPGFQAKPVVVPDPFFGAIVAFIDHRSGNFDIYAQRVGSNGLLGRPTATVGDTRRPGMLALASPFPNPARTAVQLRFTTPQRAHVSLEVFDPAGRRVRSIAARTLEPGEHTSSWDLRAEDGRMVRAGLYLVRLSCDNQTRAQRIMVTR